VVVCDGVCSMCIREGMGGTRAATTTTDRPTHPPATTTTTTTTTTYVQQQQQLSAIEWLDGGKTAKIAWPIGTTTTSGSAAAAHKVSYWREAGVVNQVTVGGASGEATLRGLVPGSAYSVEVLKLGGGDASAAAVVVAKGSLVTPEVYG
jgi:hypothetical protein